MRRFIFAFQSCVSFMVGSSLPQEQTWRPEGNNFEAQEQAWCPEGSKHRIGGLRMAPGDVAHVPRTPSPVAEAGPVARHFRSRARLRRLLAGLRPSTLHRSLRSLRQRGFALYVRLRHYRSSLLAAASNALTFVRGADRACCAPRKRRHNLTYVPSKWPLGLLYCINGFADQPIPASASRRATPKGVERAPGSGTLPPFAALTALVVRREQM